MNGESGDEFGSRDMIGEQWEVMREVKVEGDEVGVCRLN